MNRLYFAILAGLVSVSSYAQTFAQRGRIENVTDYAALTKASKSRPNKIGTLESAVLQCTGSPKIPVILVQFSDTVFRNAETPSVVRQRYDDYFNLKEGNASPSMGSVYQYFKEQSYGSFTPEFDVIGPVTLSKSYAYYGKNDGSVKDVNIREFFKEACGLVVSKENKDWKTFDNNNDGKVDMVFFIYAGEGENNVRLENPNLIWPKESTSPLTVDDVIFGAYGCTNELYQGYIDGIGTAVHELSHGLGLPDLYDTNYSTNGDGQGLDAWSVMDGGNYQIGGRCPIGYSAYERDFMGWRSVQTVDGSKAEVLTINPLETNGVAYKVANPANVNEYFILENRQHYGYDTYLGMPVLSAYNNLGAPHGLLITHVDYNQSSWKNNIVNTYASHQRMSIVPADGHFLCTWEAKTEELAKQFYESLFGDVYPGKKKVRNMSSYSVFTGGTLSTTISNICEVHGVVYASINGADVFPTLKEVIKTDIANAKSLTAKMGKSESDALASAIDACEKVGNDLDAIENVTLAIDNAIIKAKPSIELYKAVTDIITKANALGDAGKSSFAASGVKTAYDNGTIESLDKVKAAYNAAVEAQKKADEELAKAKKDLSDLVASCESLKKSKMGKSELDALTSALSAAEKANDKAAIASATKAINDAVAAANASVELYKKVAEIITKADALGEAGKASFAAAGVKTAYDNGTIESLEKVQAAYDAAVKAQEIANGIGEVGASSKASKIFGLDGKTRTEVKKGVNIINNKKVIK